MNGDPDFKAAVSAASFHNSWRRFEEVVRGAVGEKPLVLEAYKRTFYAGAYAFLKGEERLVELADVAVDPTTLNAEQLLQLGDRLATLDALIQARRDELRETIAGNAADALIFRAKSSTIEPKL